MINYHRIFNSAFTKGVKQQMLQYEFSNFIDSYQKLERIILIENGELTHMYYYSIYAIVSSIIVKQMV